MTTTDARMVSGERIGALAPEAPGDGAVQRTLQESLRRMMESVRPEGIFGSVVERDGVAVIPCAEISAGFGMGGGGGFGPVAANLARGATTGATSPEPAGAQATNSGGSGAGGGGGATGRPVAVVVLAQGKTRVLPVVDVTKLGIAALTTLGFAGFLISQMLIGRSRNRRGNAPGAMSPARFARALRGSLGPGA
ncbi:MAG TPA: spore germination protein GerW family protein [Ktedonobacterales bacterium]